MKLKHSDATFFIPNNANFDDAAKKTTHLSIGAHQDDSEIMAAGPILDCSTSDNLFFSVVTCTDGRGSPRVGTFAKYTDDQMKELRQHEQEEAAQIGNYAFLTQLNYKSSDVKKDKREQFIDDLKTVIESCNPETIYTHNPADKHATHVAVVTAVIESIRRIAPAKRPKQLLGCEVWRNLDWLQPQDKVVLDCPDDEKKLNALIGVFKSQIAGGKRYDLATIGRMKSNATFLESHNSDATQYATYAMDLTPLIQNDSLDLMDHVTYLLNQFRNDVAKNLGQY